MNTVDHLQGGLGESSPTSAKRLEDLTVGDVVRAVRLYRPFLLLGLALFLLIGVLPVVNRADSVVSSGAGPDSVVTTPAGSADGENGELSGEIGGDTGGLGSATGQGGALPAAGQSGPVAVSGDAMSAPDCDPATGRLKIPSKMFAPPCVPMWPAGADNGSATAPGVTAKSIKLVIYFPPTSDASARANAAIGINDTPQDYQADYTDWVKLFNSHYETYGRKVDVSFHTGSGTDAAAQRADAVQVASQYKPFATITQGACCWEYAKAMAARQVVTITSGQNEPQADYEKLAPYLYGAVDNGSDKSIWSSFGAYIGKRLAGKTAKWAGDPTMRTQPRKFGLLYYDNVDPSSKALFDSQLASYGAKISEQFAISASDQTLAVSQIQTAIDKFDAEGVNVVVPAVSALAVGQAAMSAATNKHYFPEWVVSMLGAWTTVILAKTLDPAQSKAMYGIKQFQPLIAAGKTEFERLFFWEYGRLTKGKSFGVLVSALQMYPLFGGIHMAGPNLNPKTFNQALFDKLPVVGGVAQGMASTYLVGYKPAGVIWPWVNYASGTDFVDAWFDPTTNSNDETQHNSPGAWWHLNGAKRYYGYPNSKIPDGEPKMFDKTGAVVQFDEVPPSDLAPAYPNAHCGHRC